MYIFYTHTHTMLTHIIYIHNRKYYWALKKKESCPFGIAQMNLKDTMSGKLIHRQMSDLTYIQNIEKSLLEMERRVLPKVKYRKWEDVGQTIQTYELKDE